MENIIANRIKYSAGLLNDFIFDWNANTRVLYIPVEWKKLIGYEDEEIENSISGIMQIVDESYQESSICNLEKLIKGEIIISKCTKKIICKNGSRKWFSVASKVVEWNTDGSPSRIIAVYTNITEKKIAEQAYEMEHRINEAMLNACKDDFFFIDREMHIISANDTFLATMKANFKKDICFGEGLFDLEFASETLKQKWLDVCTKALAGETISFNHHFYNPPTQIERWSENTLNPVWVNNEVVGVAIRSRDISRTEIQEDSAGLLSNIARNHANELQLRLFESVIKNTQDGIIITEVEPIKTEELSNSNIELERFAFVASHDLQEPLRMITNFLQLFEKKYQDVVDETGKKYIHFAVDGAIRMKELIRDLLQYSRAGSGSLEITEVDMNAIMKDVLLLFRNELYQTNVSVTITDLPVIKAGRTSMIHLMQNLISNAIKFKGVKDPYIVVSGEETPAEWIINVKDNGIGIGPEFTEKIFIVFQRLHRKEEYEGTGIGLSICKKIVERYKGKIWVESKLGQGACFKFSIPKN
jgi:PAS domain S-box-containing protein